MADCKKCLHSIVCGKRPKMVGATIAECDFYKDNQLQTDADCVRAINRMGEFGKLFIEYTGCPRGAMGRACVPLQEEVLLMPPIRDVSGGEWIPVNADALRELVADYTSLLYSRAPKEERKENGYG